MVTSVDTPAYAFTAPHPYWPLSYATVVEAGCQWPEVPDGVNISEKVSIMPDVPEVEMTRAEHVVLVAAIVVAVEVMVSVVEVATVAGLPGVAPA